MPAGGFFGGFAQSLGRGMLAAQEERDQAERQKRKLQIDLLLDQANRPDLRPEFRPILMDQIVQLAGKGTGTKGNKEFSDSIATVMDMFKTPQFVGETERIQPSGKELPMTGAIGKALPIISSTGNVLLTGGDLSKEGNTDIPVLEKIPVRQVANVIMSPEEMQDQQLRLYGRQQEIKSKYDRRYNEDQAWKTHGEEYLTPDGTRKAAQINAITGKTREITLPKGKTVRELIEEERTRRAAIPRPGADKSFAKIDEEAGKIAASSGLNAKDPKVREQFFEVAAKELMSRDELREEDARAGIAYKMATTESARVNIPQGSQPTAAAQREFSQATTQISELEAARKAVANPANAVGRTLKDGTVLTIELAKDPKLFLEKHAQLLKELDEEIRLLKSKRSATAPSAGVPQRSQGDMRPSRGTGQRAIPDLGKTTVYEMEQGSHTVGETFPLGNMQLQVLEDLGGGRYRVKRIK